jgi:hypothetical protein
MTDPHSPFPWGIHLGDWHHGDHSIPLCLPSRDGGLCCLYDDASEALPDGAIGIDLFDYSHRKRFMHLAALEPIDGYRVAYHGNAAASRFNAIEQAALAPFPPFPSVFRYLSE